MKDEGSVGRLGSDEPTALAPLRGRAPAGLEQSRSSHGAGVLPMTRALEDYVGPARLPKEARRTPAITVIETRTHRCVRRDLWPEEVFAEMEAIWEGNGE